MAASASEGALRYRVLHSFLSAAEQGEICASIGAPDLPEAGATTGRAVSLAMQTGAELPLPRYAALAAAARRAFDTFLTGIPPQCNCAEASSDAAPIALTAQDRERVRAMATGVSPMTAAAMVYRAGAEMKAHVDASVGRQPKWLVSFSFGLACNFVLGDVGATRRVRLMAGDALVFDAATVLHGVERVLPEPEPGPVAMKEAGLMAGAGAAVPPETRGVRISVMIFAALPPQDAHDNDNDNDDLEEESGLGLLF